MSLLWTSAGRTRTVTGPDGDRPKGLMVALAPSMTLARELAQHGTESPDQLHVTLAYLPAEFQPKGAAALLPEVVERWAQQQVPLEGVIAGPGTFVNPDSHVLYLSVDVPGLPEMRQDLVQMLEANGLVVAKNHGFTPHLTLAYSNTHIRFLPKVPRHPFPVSEVWACTGPTWEAFRLKGKR